MEIDLELYRHEVRVSTKPLIRLSAIDVAPDHFLHTMVFIHGYGGRATQWQYQLRNFSDANRVIAPDLRGHGLSDKPRSGYNMPTILSDLRSILDSLGVHGPIVLIGHSFGGAIATEFACASPELVSHLVLIASSGEYKLNPLYRLLLKLPVPALSLAAPFTRKWLGAPPYALKAMYNDTLSSWNGWNLLRGLTIPTLVIRGHLDVVFEKPLFEEVSRAIPMAEEFDVGASGHMVMLERREAVNRAISRFIETDKRFFSQVDSQRPAKAGELKPYGELIRERPWLPFYDEGVPATISVPHVPLDSLLRSAARRFPRKTALIFEGTHIPYGRLNQETNRFANLLCSLGIEPGERVMLLLPNIPQLVIAFFGLLKGGAIAVFTLPTPEPEELIRQIQDSGASVLVTLTQFDPLIRDIIPKLEASGVSPLKHIILTHIGDYLPPLKRLGLFFLEKKKRITLPEASGFIKIYHYNRLLYTHKKTRPEVHTSPNELAAIIYTGGTTDKPKGVMLSHRNLVANALQTRHWMPEAKEGQECVLCPLPFVHSYGLTAGLNVAVSLGATMVLKPRFQAMDILRAIKKYHPTIFPGVPQMYVALKDYPGVRKFGISSIKACISGSAPLPIEVQEAFEKLTRGRLVEGYGLTEASPVTHANPLRGLRKVGSIGIPLPSTQARIVDLRKSTEEVPIGRIGELAVKGPQVMMGYWKNPRATSKVLTKDGWLLTGDVAQMDSDGYFRIIARKADMWYPTKPGQPAFPRDVEEVLFEVPQIKEVAVVAIAGQPIAFVIAKADHPGADVLIAYCKRRLPPELVPRLVIFVEDFPRSYIGKVLRRELAKHFRESRKGT